MDSNRFNKILELHKSASKVGRRSASGINFSYAESALAQENPGVSFSKEQVLERILEDPAFSNEDLDSIFEINIENHHAKMMNKKERAFIEIGAFLTQKQDHIQEIGDYLMSESAKPGWIEERHGDSFFSKESIAEAFSQLDQAQRDFHEEAARRDAEERTAAGRFGNGYETNEVIKEFEDGWKVVYVPAVGEGPNYKGDQSKSNDRTVEGNILGLCLGASSGLYQTNSNGKIYSVRDPNNNPKVTIRIDNNILKEAKGKNNLAPDVEAAKKTAKWLESQDELQYKDSRDFQQFPPLNAQDAKNKFERNPDEAYSKGWIVNWYRSGVDPIDNSIEARVASKDISIVHSGLGKKYKQLAQPVVEYWAKRWIEKDDSKIWANFNPTHLSHLSHESWKTYRKESWMIDAVEKLMSSEMQAFGFKIGIQTIPEYAELAMPAAKSLAEKSPKDFFYLRIQEYYPDLAATAAKSLVEKSPKDFFNLRMQETYPDLEVTAAKSLAEKSPKDFFTFKNSFKLRMQEAYPDLEATAARGLAEEYPQDFFAFKMHETYPDLGSTAAKGFGEKSPKDFFNLGMQETYPDLAATAAKALIAGVNDYAMPVADVPQSWSNQRIERFQNELNERTLSDENRVKGAIDFFEKGLHHMFPDLGYSAAENIARFAPIVFFRKRFSNLFPNSEGNYFLAEMYPGRLWTVARIAQSGYVPEELPDEEIGMGKEVPFGNMDEFENMDEVNPYFSTYEEEEENPENFYNDPDFNEEEPSDLDFVDPKDSPPPTYVLPEDAVGEVEVIKRRSKLSSLQSYLNKSGLEKEADEVGMMIKSLYQINLKLK